MYFFSLGSVSLIYKNEKDISNYQNLFLNLISITSIFNKLNSISFINKFFEFIKLICQIDEEEKLNEKKNENNISKIKKILINFRIYSLFNKEEKKEHFSNINKILEDNNITNEGLIRLMSIMILHFFKIDLKNEFLNVGDIKFDKQLDIINKLKEVFSF